MNVATILENLKSQALVGNTGAASDNDRLLRYLNKAYCMVYAEIAAINPALFQEYQTMSVTGGLGSFATPVFKVLSAVDLTNGNRKLTTRSTDDIERDDPTASTEGAPVSYEQTFRGLSTYPRNSTTLRIRFTPNPNTLDANTLESDILVPVLYHEVLEWATLLTIAYDERDKLVGSELQFTKSTFETMMDKLRQYVSSTLPQDKLRVKTW